MSEIKGVVGSWPLCWKSVPHGKSGMAHVQIESEPGAKTGRLYEVRWKRDEHGIWIETESGVFGFDLERTVSDDGQFTYQVSERGTARQWIGVSFQRAGDRAAVASGVGVKKIMRIKAQMPGKIIRILIKSGVEVSKGQSLLVIEAMKMENEIRAPEAGKVSKLNVSEGQAVETGTELMMIDPA